MEREIEREIETQRKAAGLMPGAHFELQREQNKVGVLAVGREEEAAGKLDAGRCMDAQPRAHSGCRDNPLGGFGICQDEASSEKVY
jgi:hypothetical protein